MKVCIGMSAILQNIEIVLLLSSCYLFLFVLSLLRISVKEDEAEEEDAATRRKKKKRYSLA